MASTEIVNPQPSPVPSMQGEAPMWIFDQETLAFLEVNEAAVRKYGYSRDEFLNMTILDIRPLDDVPTLLRHTLNPGKRGPSMAEKWRHRNKDGTVFEVEITSWELMFHGRPAEMVVAVDVVSASNTEIPRPVSKSVV